MRRGGAGARRGTRHRLLAFSTNAAAQVGMAVGLTCACWEWGVRATFGLAVFFVIAGAAMVAAFTALPRGQGIRTAIEQGAVGGLSGVAVIGSCVASGALGALVLVLLLMDSWAFRAMVRRCRPGEPDRRAGSAASERDAAARRVVDATPVGPGRDQLDLLDDATLCRTWRESFHRVRRAHTVRELEGVVEQRRRCLDELERRSPDGFAAWIASGAQPGGDPSPFLRKQPPATT